MTVYGSCTGQSKLSNTDCTSRVSISTVTDTLHLRPVGVEESQKVMHKGMQGLKALQPAKDNARAKDYHSLVSCQKESWLKSPGRLLRKNQAISTSSLNHVQKGSVQLQFVYHSLLTEFLQATCNTEPSPTKWSQSPNPMRMPTHPSSPSSLGAQVQQYSTDYTFSKRFSLGKVCFNTLMACSF